ncbi:MAG: HD domain-containing protein [Candidatus Tectomicrobia bacterium]|uniref:HD domain-containing protein n=1 Tax=Tectimicrobiota bacterium TaxID=2528274 RepID=A0A932MMA0_UNCTE|nr:HD domain-containing protein [Candidatus Tectomicrobia bacterium]
MRLSDLIKQGPEGQDPKKKQPPKPETPPDEEAPAEEEAFRLSEVADFRQPPQQPRPAPPRRPADEEAPLAPPALPGPGAAPQGRTAPEEETAAAPPDLGIPSRPQRPAAAPPSVPDPPAEAPARPRRRGSMLMGPEPGAERGDDLTSQAGAASRARTENPFRPLRQRAIEYVTGAFQAIGKGTPLSLEDGEDIIFDCLEHPNALEQLYSLAVGQKDTTNSLAIHLVNHATYALKLGRGLKWSPERLVRLGVASLLHDVGMCWVPQHIRHKEGKLAPEEMNEIRKHPEYGLRIVLENFGEPFRWLGEALYHEHEREDGRGYPQGLLGNEVSEYAKIIGLADVYEALTHNRPHRKRLLPHKAVQEIIQTQKTSFHQRLLKVMLEELSVFSLNSLVRLNSNAIGRVAQTVPGQPLRPIVQLLYDGDGNEISDERLISLKDFPLLYIVDSLDETEVPRP